MANLYYALLDFIYETDWIQVLFWAKVVSGILSALFLLGVSVLAIKINVLGRAAILFSEAANTSAIPKKRLLKKWGEIKKKVEAGDDANLRLSVIEADKLFDGLLMRMGYHGNSMGERLEKITPAQFPRIQEIWDAHKIRNNIVHDTDYHPAREEVEKAIKTYEAVLEELEAI